MGSSIRSRPNPLYWVFLFLGYTIGIVATGAVAGGLAFQLFGRLFVPEMTFAELSLAGLRVGTILSGVWAPGVAIVLCFMRGKRLRDERRQKEETS